MVRRKLAAQWHMPVELAIDVAALALYDIVIMAGVLNPLSTQIILGCTRSSIFSVCNLKSLNLRQPYSLYLA